MSNPIHEHKKITDMTKTAHRSLTDFVYKPPESQFLTLETSNATFEKTNMADDVQEILAVVDFYLLLTEIFR